MSFLFRLVLVVLIALSSSASWSYAYDVVSSLLNHLNVESELQKFGYADATNFHYCCSKSPSTLSQKRPKAGIFLCLMLV
ncbi:MAG: hypothetical protein JKX81_20075 [Arenicella sp.]|nr:hypothetical protein [Arenicella sp.]